MLQCLFLTNKPCLHLWTCFSVIFTPFTFFFQSIDDLLRNSTRTSLQMKNVHSFLLLLLKVLYHRCWRVKHVLFHHSTKWNVEILFNFEHGNLSRGWPGSPTSWGTQSDTFLWQFLPFIMVSMTWIEFVFLSNHTHLRLVVLRHQGPSCLVFQKQLHHHDIFKRRVLSNDLLRRIKLF